VERSRSQAEDSNVRAGRPPASYESSPSRDDWLLFVLSLVSLAVASVLAALWVLVEINFAFIWFILGALALGVILLVMFALR
jgi:hypothetical protein